MQSNTQMYNLGIQHAKEQMKVDKKQTNVKEIEDILYTKTNIPMKKPVKHLKTLDFEKIHMIMYDLGIKLLPEYDYMTEEQCNEYEDSFRKFLIKIYFYINYKNDEIKKIQDELELVNEKYESAKENCANLTEELETIESKHVQWKNPTAALGVVVVVAFAVAAVVVAVVEKSNF